MQKVVLHPGKLVVTTGSEEQKYIQRTLSPDMNAEEYQ